MNDKSEPKPLTEETRDQTRFAATLEEARKTPEYRAEMRYLEIEELKIERDKLQETVKLLRAQLDHSSQRRAHTCQLLGVDFCCEEPETCEQVIERWKKELESSRELEGRLETLGAEYVREKKWADKMTAENVGLRDALDKLWHAAGAGFVKREPYEGWVATIESALKTPETTKVQAVLEAAKALCKSWDTEFEPAHIEIDGQEALENAVRAWKGDK